MTSRPRLSSRAFCHGALTARRSDKASGGQARYRSMRRAGHDLVAFGERLHSWESVAGREDAAFDGTPEVCRDARVRGVVLCDIHSGVCVR